MPSSFFHWLVPLPWGSNLFRQDKGQGGIVKSAHIPLKKEVQFKWRKVGGTCDSHFNHVYLAAKINKIPLIR